MSDLIDRDSLRGKLAYTDFKDISDWQKINELIDNQPKVDPVKHGHWIYPDDYFDEGDNIFECSVCHFTLQFPYYDPDENEHYYCPKCGARLIEVTE